MSTRRLCVFLLLSIALTACSGGGGGSSGSNSKLEATSNSWDTMNWDEGKWN